jgi:hypothetical protein
MNYFPVIWNKIKKSSPFSLSLVIHVIVLLIFSYITWYSPSHRTDDFPASISLQGQKNDVLRFQDKDHLDSFKAKDNMVYPLPEIEYQPVLPEVKFYPESKIKDELEFIGVETMDRKLLQPSTGRQPLYTGEEKLAGSFSRHIQILREGGLEIVFIFDSSSSMAQFLIQIKFKIRNMVETFKQLVPTARIGLVTYRDIGEEFVTRAHQLTYGTKSLREFLIEIEAIGGGDREEAVDEALRVAIDEFNWKKKSKKIILLIGDAPPHAKDMEKTIKLINKFQNKMHGTVSTLDTSTRTFKPVDGSINKKVIDEFKIIAEAGNGESSRLENEEKVIRQMVTLVFGTRWESCLDEFMKNL